MWSITFISTPVYFYRGRRVRTSGHAHYRPRQMKIESRRHGARIYMTAPQEQPKKDNMRTLAKLGSDATKWTVVAIVSAAVLYKRDISIALYAIGSILNSAMGKGMKKVIAQPRPNGSWKEDHGMPSSHATALSYLSTAALINIVLHHGHLGLTWPILIACVSVALAGMASWWRVISGYHSATQVIAGWVLGVVNAIVWSTMVTPLIMRLL